MCKRKSTTNFSAILSALIILLVVVAVVGFLLIYTNNFSTDLKTFHVKHGSDDFIGDRDNYTIIVGQEYDFEVVSPLNTENSFVVSVVPNTSIDETTFSFYLNNTYRQFIYEESLTEGFEIVPYGNGFRFKATKDISEILQAVYPNKTITGCPTAVDSGIPYFRLVISSADGSQSININFNLRSKQI